MDDAMRRRLRAETRAFVAEAGTRRALPLTCCVGLPGGERVRLWSSTPLSRGRELADPLAPGLAEALVERALDGLHDPLTAFVWMTRLGPLRLGDHEAGWFAAARAAYARHGLTLPAFVLVNRHGWLDLVSDEHREWRRVRVRRRAAQPTR